VREVAGRKVAAGEHEVFRGGLTDAPREPYGPSAAGYQPVVRVRVPEAGHLGGDHEVTSEDQLESAGHREPVDGGDDGLGEGLDAVD
jgi:hypothetical protein